MLDLLTDDEYNRFRRMPFKDRSLQRHTFSSTLRMRLKDNGMDEATGNQQATTEYSRMSREELLEVIKKQSEVIDDKDAVIKKQSEVIYNRDAVIKKQSDVIKKQSEVIEEDSVQKLLKEGLPDMHENPKCTPSIIDNKNAIQDTLKRRKGESRKGHDVAEIKTCTMDLSLFEFHPNIKWNDGSLIKSDLRYNIIQYRKRKFDHDNETSPQDYVGYLLKDVIRCCGIDARVIKEATVFSLRPDLLVVEYQGRILIAVEIKNPGVKKVEGSTEKLTIFNAMETGGQVFDYLKGLGQYGNNPPIVVLSNYREMVICCLTKDHESVMSLIQQVSQKYQNKKGQTLGAQNPCASEKPEVSPEKPKGHFISLPIIPSQKDANEEMIMDKDEESEGAPHFNGNYSEQDVEADFDIRQFDFQGRSVTYSQVITLESAFHALTLAVEAAVLSVDGSSVDFEVPKHMSHISKELCALGEKSFNWQNFNVDIRYDKVPRLGKNFSVGVLASIGQGRTGKCLLCCTTTGITFVAKLFVPQASFLYSEEERKKEMVKFLEKKRKEAEEECRRWKELFGKYKKFCQVSELNEIPALIMPYFSPLKKCERRVYLNDVRALLMKVASSGYTYGSDVRWSHVGLRGDSLREVELVLLDLESLQQVGKRKAEKEVDAIVKTLEKRMDANDVQCPSAPPLVKSKGP